MVNETPLKVIHSSSCDKTGSPCSYITSIVKFSQGKVNYSMYEIRLNSELYSTSLFPDSTITWNCYLMFLTQSPTGRLACSSLAQGWPSSTSSRNLFPTNQLFQVSHRQLSRKSILLLCCYSLQVPLDLSHGVTFPFPASHYWDHQQQQPRANTPP